MQGKLSDPFVPLTSSDQGNTDDTRPSFAQKGNTYFPIRQIIPTAANNFGTTNQFQYYGLVSKFHELAITGRLDYTRWEPYKLSLPASTSRTWRSTARPPTRSPSTIAGRSRAAAPSGNFAGGNTGWIVDLKFGSATLDKPWNWVLGANYRHVESDAVVDAFTDSDFGGGGTNLQGFTSMECWRSRRG